MMRSGVSRREADRAPSAEFGVDGGEFFVQGELLGQCGAQLRIIVGDQDFQNLGHRHVLD